MAQKTDYNASQLACDAQALAPTLAEWRHALHQIPEVALELPQTSAYVQARLAEMGVPFRTAVDGSCVIALIGRGAVAAAAAEPAGTASDEEAGPTILLRGDMDALPVAEESGEPFASVNGYMHACGHDLHATALLGAARLLKDREDQIAAQGCTVKLVFQPGEEVFLGARAAIADGLLENPRVDAAYAQHVIAMMPLGTVSFGLHPLSGIYGFRIIISGKGGHGSSPEACIDPITCGVHVHLALQELVAREVPAAGEVALTVGRFAGGSVANIIPDTCEIEGTMRGFDPALMQALVARIDEAVAGVAAAYRCTATVEAVTDIPPVKVDEAFMNACRGYIAAADPSIPLSNTAHSMPSEDFSLVSQRVPAAYFLVGARPLDQERGLPQHNPKVRFADEALPQAALQYAAVALGWVADHAQPAGPRL